MTAVLAPRTVTWERHRPPGGRWVAVGYYGDAEAVRLTGPLLRLQIAAWDRLLARWAARSRAQATADR